MSVYPGTLLIISGLPIVTITLVASAGCVSNANAIENTKVIPSPIPKVTNFGCAVIEFNTFCLIDLNIVSNVYKGNIKRVKTQKFIKLYKLCKYYNKLISVFIHLIGYRIFICKSLCIIMFSTNFGSFRKIKENLK